MCISVDSPVVCEISLKEYLSPVNYGKKSVVGNIGPRAQYYQYLLKYIFSIGKIYICGFFTRQLGPVNHGKKSVVDIGPMSKRRFNLLLLSLMILLRKCSKKIVYSLELV
jgi:hypothetical protein